MFSSTAYEAFYSYIGLYLHSASIKIITSHEILIALLLLILGCSFMLGAWRHFSKYMPGFMGRGRSVGPAFFFKIMACFLIGVSLLRVGSDESVKLPSRKSWSNNSYIQSRMPSVYDRYEVSFLFSLLVRSAEELARLGDQIVDHLFKRTNSELEAPSAFYRAVIFAGSQTIDDPSLRDLVDVYSRNCFDTALIAMAKGSDRKIDEFFRSGGAIDAELDLIPLTDDKGRKYSCLDLKDQVRHGLESWSYSKGAGFLKFYSGRVDIPGASFDETQRNMIVSNALVNHYLSKNENWVGTSHGAAVEGTFAKSLMWIDRLFSWDGFLSLIGQKDQVGAVLTAKRASQFSEYLQRAPHLKGLVKLFLIAIFPWLVFFVVAGRWKVLVSWFALYTSVLLWSPIWTLLYHLMTSIALSTDLLAEFGRLNDGISLYSSQLIKAKIYQFYAIYSWLQLIVGPLPTVVLAYGMVSSVLKDSEPEQAPAAAQGAKDITVGAATGGVSGAAGAAIKKV